MAGMKVSVKITRNKLPAIARQLPVAANQIVQARGAQMVPIAKERSRVDTGAMRDGWRWERTGHASGQLVNDVPYTVYNELGWVGKAAQPMAGPAAAQIFPLIQDDFRHLEDAID